MIEYSNAELFMNDSTSKNLIITDGTVTVSGSTYSVTGETFTITNSLLEQEGFTLTQYLCSENELKYGSCNSARLQFVMHDNIPSIKGKWVKVYMYLNGDVSTMLQLGIYKVDEDKLSSDRTVRNITAYDRMYDVLHTDVAAWYNTVLPNSTSTITLGNFRKQFLINFDIPYEDVTLVNDSMEVKRTISPDQLDGKTVICSICELNGVFGTITNEGIFRFVELSENLDSGLFPSDTLYPSDDLFPSDPNPVVTQVERSHYSSVTFEDWNSEAITQLLIRQSEEDAGVTVGTVGNRYTIQNNFLVYGKTTSALTQIANNTLLKIKGRYYKPCTVEAIGNPLHEVGDGIRIRTTYRGIVTYILQRTLSGIQALKDTYKAEGEQYYSVEVKSVESQFKQLAGKTASLMVNVDGIEGRVEDIEDGTASVITQLSNSISLKVSSSNIVSELDSHMSGINIESNKIEVTSSGTFTVDSQYYSLDADGNVTLNNSSSFDKGILKAVSYNGTSQSEFRSDCVSFKVAGTEYVRLDVNNQTLTLGSSSDSQRTYLSYNDGKIHGNTILTTANIGSQTCGALTASTMSGDVPTIGTIRQANGNGVYSNKTIYWKQFQNLEASDFVVCAR